jgi:O-antigen ligase
MTDTQRRWLVRCGWLVAFLLPLAFNPLALADPFETPKVWLFHLIILGMVGIALWPRPLKLVENPLTVPVVVYGVIVMVATAGSINIRTSLWGDAYPHGALLTLTALIFFLLLSSALYERGQVEQLINVILIGSVPVVLYGFIQFAGLDPIAWTHDSVSAVHSTLGRSLYLGSYLAMVVPFTLLRLIQHRANRQRQIAFVAILLLQVSGLLFTLARGAWLGFLGGMVLFAVLVLGRRFRIAGIVLLLIAGVVGLFVISQRGWVVFPMLQVGEDLGRVRAFSLDARLTTWQDALALVPHRWLLGYGPETFATAVSQQLGITPGPYELHMPDPHNLFLYQVTAVGLAGLSAFLWLIGRFYTVLADTFRQTNAPEIRLRLAAILSSTTAYLIQAQFNPDMISLSALFWINLALGITLVRLAVTTNDNN